MKKLSLQLPVLLGLFVLAPLSVRAEGPPPPPQPVNANVEDFQQRALKFTRKEADRWDQHASQLEKQAKQAAEKTQAAQKKLQQAQSAQSQAEKRLQQIDANLKQAQQAKQEAEKSRQTALQQVKKLQKELEAERKKLAQANQKIAQAAEKLAEQREKMKEAQAALEKAQKQAEKKKSKGSKEKDGKKEEADKSGKDESGKKDSGNQTKDQDKAQAEIQQAQKQLDAANQAIKNAQSQKAAAQKAKKPAQQAVQKREAELKKTQQQAEQAEKQIEEQTKQLAALSKDKQQVQKNLKQAQAQIKQAQETLKPLKEAQAKAEKEAGQARKKADQAAKKLAWMKEHTPQADPESLREIKTLKHDRPLWACAIEATGNYLFTGAQGNTLQRWDLFTGSKTELEGHNSWVRRFTFHPQTGRLITAGYEGKLIWWNSQSSRPDPQRSIQAHKGFARAVAVSPNGRWIATGGNDNLVKIWSAEDGSLVKELPGHERHVYNVAFHPNGKYLVSGDLVGVLKKWEVGTWKHVGDLKANELHKYDNSFRADCGGFRAMDFSPRGRYLAVGGIGEVSNAFAGVGKPTVVLFDWATGEKLQVMKSTKNVKGPVWGLKFHPSGQFLAGIGGRNSGYLWFWKVGEKKSFFDFKLPKVGFDIAFHPDGLRFAAALFDKTVRIYDISPKLEVAEADKKKKDKKK